MTYYQARESCTSSHYLLPNGDRGYLATITSIEEYEFIKTNVGSTSAWISGHDSNEKGVFRYGSGPEDGQIMYNLFTEECTSSVCPWIPDEPSLKQGKSFIALTGDDNLWATYSATDVLTTFVCEFGGFLSLDNMPVISPMSLPTHGGEVRISSITAANGAFVSLSGLVITAKNTKNGATSNLCSSITPSPNDLHSVLCDVIPRVGTYVVSVTIPSISYTTRSFHFNFIGPAISLVYPKWQSGELLTIVGTNFGDTFTGMSVRIGPTKVDCTLQTILAPHQAFTCTLAASVTTLLPIELTVGGCIVISSRTPAFYYPPTQKYYSLITKDIKFYEATGYVASKFLLYGQRGQLGTIPSTGVANYLKSLTPLSPGGMCIWMNARFNSYPSNAGYYSFSGESAGVKMVPSSYFTSMPATSGLDFDSRFGGVLSDGRISVESEYNHNFMFIDYNQSPFFVYSVGQSGMSSSGGPLMVKLANFGTLFSNMTLAFRGQPLFKRALSSALRQYGDINEGYFRITIPAGYGGPYPIDLIVDGRVSSNQQEVTYAAPAITSISSVPIGGGYITITGSNLYTDPAVTTVSSGSVQCTNIQFIVYHLSLRCLAPNGLSGLVVITVGGVASNGLSVTSDTSPYITSASSVPLYNGVTTINGYNFGSIASGILVTIGGSACTNLQIITATTSISCSVTLGSGPFKVSVTVASQASNQDVVIGVLLPLLSSVSVGSSIVLSGTSLHPYAYIRVGSNTVYLSCSGSFTSITCNIPSNTSNGLVGMTQSNEIPINFTPTITSAMEQSGSIILINGNHFVTAQGQPSPVTLGSFTITPFCAVQYTLIICGPIPASFESSSIKVGNSQSVNFQFTPTITQVYPLVPTSGGAVTIEGEHFANVGGLVLTVTYAGSIVSSSLLTIVSTTKIIYQITPGAGPYPLFVTSGSKSSNTIIYRYQPPTINSITQTSSTTLSISGLNFGTSSTVTIGSLNCVVNSQSHTSVVVTIPSAANSGLVVVSVGGVQSNGFIISLTPTITSATEQSGSTILINGNHFVTAQGQPSPVTLGSFTITPFCTFQYTSITCGPIPASLDSTSIKVGNSQSVNFQFTPTITQVYPSSIPTPGGAVTIEGEHFANSGGLVLTVTDSSVNVPGSSLTVLSTTKIIYQVPAGSGTNKIIRVTSGSKSSNTISYSYQSPTINSIIPKSSSTLSISGLNFGSSPTVTIGSLVCVVNTQSHIGIEFTIPSAAKNGLVTVTVGGQSTSYPVKIKPVIINVTEPSVDGGSITVTSHFTSQTNEAGSTTNSLFYLDGTVVICRVSSPVSPYVFICPIGDGCGKLVLQMIHDQVASDVYAFRYQPPTITSISKPYYGPAMVTITGTNFFRSQPFVEIMNSTYPCYTQTKSGVVKGPSIVLSSTRIMCTTGNVWPPVESTQLGGVPPFPMSVGICGTVINTTFEYQYVELLEIYQDSFNLFLEGIGLGATGLVPRVLDRYQNVFLNCSNQFSSSPKMVNGEVVRVIKCDRVEVLISGYRGFEIHGAGPVVMNIAFLMPTGPL
eukprot:gene6752-7847_t